jgi:hypothetical protein
MYAVEVVTEVSFFWSMRSDDEHVINVMESADKIAECLV